MNRADYPSDWASISRQIREQANHKCEFCGVPNRAYGARDRYGDWHDEDAIDALNSTEGERLFGAGWDWKMTRIVLTVAHLCHDTRCTDPTHMRAACQKCHFTLDREPNMRKATETRRRKREQERINTGQVALEMVE